MTPVDGAPFDVTALCRRLAARLAARGAPHPLAAAVALAVRGCRAQGPAAFAADLAIDPVVLARIDAGEVPWDAWPHPLVAAAQATPELRLDDLWSCAPWERAFEPGDQE